MVVCSFVGPVTLAGLGASAWLSGLPAGAAPAGAAVRFAPPLAAARTIQVTEAVWEAQGGAAPGPLRQAGTMAFRIERPDKFWVRWRVTRPSRPPTPSRTGGRW